MSSKPGTKGAHLWGGSGWKIGHVFTQVPDREALRTLVAAKVPIHGASDHANAEA